MGAYYEAGHSCQIQPPPHLAAIPTLRHHQDKGLYGMKFKLHSLHPESGLEP